MTIEHTDLSIDEYLRERLMPVEGSIPRIPGIELPNKFHGAGSGAQVS